MKYKEMESILRINSTVASSKLHEVDQPSTKQRVNSHYTALEQGPLALNITV